METVKPSSTKTEITHTPKKLKMKSKFYTLMHIIPLNNCKLSDFLDPIYPIELERRIPQIELGLLHTLTYIWQLTVRTDENFTFNDKSLAKDGIVT
jgi:hypothetical protein